MLNITPESVHEAVQKSQTAIDDPILQNLFELYNESSPREDSPVYYRFLYYLANLYKDDDLKMVEIGCKYGAASLHFLKGGGASAWAIDTSSEVKFDLFSGLSFSFHQGSSIDSSVVNISPMADVLFIDTDHTYETTKTEFDLWLPKVNKGGVMLFDDITASEYGCTKFWNELKGEKLTFPELHPVGWGFGVYFVK